MLRTAIAVILLLGACSLADEGQPGPARANAPATAATASAPRTPIPDAAAPLSARRKIAEAFSQEIAAKTEAGKIAGARKLLKIAGESRDDPPARYVA